MYFWCICFCGFESLQIFSYGALFFGGPFILPINFKCFISSTKIIKTSRSLLSFWSRDYWWWTVVCSNSTLSLSDIDEIFGRIRYSKNKLSSSFAFVHVVCKLFYINNLFLLNFMWQYIALYNSTNKTIFNYWFNLPLIIEDMLKVWSWLAYLYTFLIYNCMCNQYLSPLNPVHGEVYSI